MREGRGSCLGRQRERGTEIITPTCTHRDTSRGDPLNSTGAGTNIHHQIYNPLRSSSGDKNLYLIIKCLQVERGGGWLAEEISPPVLSVRSPHIHLI